MKHLLAIGATGMLGDALAHLAQVAHRTSSISRSVTHRAPAGVRTYDADWTSPSAFREAVESAITDHGPPTHVLMWMHTSGADSAKWLLGRLEGPCVVAHVLGSASGDPRADDDVWKRLCAPGVERRTIVLGAVQEAGHTRWLTHTEISAGALSAFQDERSIVIGELGIF